MCYDLILVRFHDKDSTKYSCTLYDLSWISCVPTFPLGGFQQTFANKRLLLLKAQPAQNLLKSETYRKWRCASAGEKQASIILEVNI